MNYIVIHEAIRYGEVEKRVMYRGTSKRIAGFLAYIVFFLFAQSLDAVYVCTEAR